MDTIVRMLFIVFCLSNSFYPFTPPLIKMTDPQLIFWQTVTIFLAMTLLCEPKRKQSLIVFGAIIIVYFLFPIIPSHDILTMAPVV